VPKIERTIDTIAPVELAWRFLSDFTTTEQWDPPTVRTVRLSGDGGVGTVYENRSHILGRDSDITYTVVESRPHQRLRLHGDNDTVAALDTIELVARTGGGTRVRYTADYTLKGVAKLAGPLGAAVLSRIGDRAAEQMRRCLDALGDPRRPNGAPDVAV
jgi:carbon monoxide dehydrogenase subunit G